MRLLHCSDLHLLALSGVSPREYFNKRITGAINLWFARARAHDERRFEAMLHLAQEERVQHVLVSGDLVNLGLVQEFEAVQAKLEQSGLSFYVVPGNHDIYVPHGEPKLAFSRVFSRYLGPALGQGDPQGEDEVFPYAVDWGSVVLFGLNSSIPRPAFFADGRLGPAQLERLEAGLWAAASDKKFRILMLHHPVTAKASRPRRDLQDRAALAAVLARTGAELILHGHEHRQYEDELEGPEGSRILVHGVASGTATSQHPERAAACTIYQIESSDSGVEIGASGQNRPSTRQVPGIDCSWTRFAFDTTAMRWRPSPVSGAMQNGQEPGVEFKA